MSIFDEMQGLNLEPDKSELDIAIENTEKFEARFREDNAEALSDWWDGAIQGAEEVGRAATAVAAQNPAYFDEYTTDPVEMTPELQKAVEWHEEAKEVFRQETVRPAAMGASVLGGVGFATYLPFMAEDYLAEVDKKGFVDATVDTAKSFVPGYDAVTLGMDDDFNEYAMEHPGRASMQMFAATAPNVVPALAIGRRILKTKPAKKVAEGLNKLDENIGKRFEPQETPAPKSIIEEMSETPEPKAFRTEKPKTPMEEANMGVNETVSRNIDKIMEEAQDTPTVDIQPFKGAYDTEVTAAKPREAMPVKIVDIMKTANEITPVRTGSTPGGTLGYYQPVREGARVKSFKDFDILSHEIGHALDEKFGLKGFDGELEGAAKSRWGDAYKPNELRGEGIAEFTAEYVMNPEVAQKNFPGYYKAFTEALKKDTDLAPKMDRLGEQVKNWYHQTPESRARGATVFVGDIETPKGAYTKTLWDSFKNSMVDSNHAFKEGISAWEKVSGLTLKASENPARMAEAIKSTIPARAAILAGMSKNETKFTIAALNEVYNGVLKHEVTMKEVLAPLDRLTEKGNKLAGIKAKYGTESVYEAFGSYAVARHTLDVINVKNAERVAKLQERIDSIKAKVDSGELKGDATASIKTLQDKINDIQQGRSDYKTTISKADAMAVVKDAPSEFRVASLQMRKMNDNVLALWEHFGLTDADTIKLFKEQYPNYVPMVRDFSLEAPTKSEGVAGRSGFANISKAFYELSQEGSERPITDPMIAYTRAIARMIDKGERNKVGQALVNISNKAKGGHILMETSEAPNRAKGIFSVWENGEKKNYQAMLPGIYEAVMEMDKAPANMVISMVSKVGRMSAQTLRKGATATPVFMIWNFLKDSVFSSITSKTGMKPFVSSLEGFFLRSDKELMARFEAAGVPFATQLGGDIRLSDTMRKFSGELSFMEKNPVLSKINRAIEAGMDMSQIVEEAPRAVEFKRILERGGSLFEAGEAGRDLSLNFMRAGSAGRTINQFIPFFNAVVQGGDKVFRTFAENPAQTLMRGGMYITLPSVLLWNINRDKDWYRQLTYDQKMKNWYIQAGETVYVYPKPELFGYLFGSIPERILEYGLDGDTKALDASDLGSFMFNENTPSIIPQVVKPIAQWTLNYDFFRQQKIVSDKYLKLDEPYQFNVYTSEIAKGIGSATGMSPMMIDSTLKTMGGSTATFMLGAFDRVLKDGTAPAVRADELFRVTLPQGKRTRTAEVFDKGYKDLEREVTTAKATGRKVSERNFKGMKQAQAAINKQRAKYNAILNSDLDGETKRQRMDAVRDVIDGYQRKANSKYLGYKYIQNVN